jgi:hypothetical protein
MNDTAGSPRSPLLYHHVEWHLSRERVDGNVRCFAPEGAFCRLTCDQGCEEWGPDHEHPLTDSGCCNVVEFLVNGDSIEDVYDGPSTLLRSGFIEPEWQGDHYTWHYRDEREVLQAMLAAPDPAKGHYATNEGPK